MVGVLISKRLGTYDQIMAESFESLVYTYCVLIEISNAENEQMKEGKTSK